MNIATKGQPYDWTDRDVNFKEVWLQGKNQSESQIVNTLKRVII